MAIDPKPKVVRKVRTGGGNVLKRGKSGTEVETPGSAVINNETLAEDRAYMADKGDRQYAGNSAPRAGGSAQPAQSPGLKGSSKKGTTRKSIIKIKRSSASPIAKKSAIRLVKRG